MTGPEGNIPEGWMSGQVSPDTLQSRDNSTPLVYNLSGTYTLDGGEASFNNMAYTSETTDVSSVYVTGGGELALVNPSITKGGNTSSDSASSFYGLNAAVLATNGSTIRILGGTITTNGSGANGAFSSGTGSSIILSDVWIQASGEGGHGVMTSNGGSLTLSGVDITTSGSHGAPLATDRGGGSVTVTGGSVTSSGIDSPGIYSTGKITASGTRVSATAAEAAVIEGANSITLTDSMLEGATGSQDKGIMIYQSMSGDASAGTGSFVMSGGTYTWPSATGPAFYVTNTKAVINLTSVTMKSSSETLLEAAAGRWGTSGDNGGSVTFLADNENLTGSLISDSISSISATLQNGTILTGSIKSASLTLDKSSTWHVTGESFLNGFTDTDGILGTSIQNIVGNGFTVYYDPDATGNSILGEKTYSLVNGGSLVPQRSNDRVKSFFNRENASPSHTSEGRVLSHNSRTGSLQGRDSSTGLPGSIGSGLTGLSAPGISQTGFSLMTPAFDIPEVGFSQIVPVYSIIAYNSTLLKATENLTKPLILQPHTQVLQYSLSRYLPGLAVNATHLEGSSLHLKVNNLGYV